MYMLDGPCGTSNAMCRTGSGAKTAPRSPGSRPSISIPSIPTYGEYQLGSPTLAGKDKTVGPSGACGQNPWLSIEMPLRLDKIA